MTERIKCKENTEVKYAKRRKMIKIRNEPGNTHKNIKSLKSNSIKNSYPFKKNSRSFKQLTSFKSTSASTIASKFSASIQFTKRSLRSSEMHFAIFKSSCDNTPNANSFLASLTGIVKNLSCSTNVCLSLLHFAPFGSNAKQTCCSRHFIKRRTLRWHEWLRFHNQQKYAIPPR